MKNSHKSHLSYCTGKGRYICTVLCICMTCLVFKGCVPENIAIPNRIVSIATSDVANVTAKGATLSGKVVTNDADTITCGVIYGTESSLTSASGTKQATTAHGDFSIIVTGLDAQTTYYYRAYGIDAGRYKYGEVRSFETKPSISITTSDSVDVTASTATLRGMVSNAEEAMTCGIIYGTSSSLSSTSGTVLTTTSAGAYSLSVTELDENTTYYYRAYVVDGDEYKYGEVLSFKTKLKISITTSQPVDVTATTATLGGEVVNAEEALPCGIIYGTSSSLSSTSGTVLTATSDGAYSLSVTELDENTTYYYRAFVVDGEEYKYGEVRSFKTKLKISITTSQPIDVTATTATLGGEVVNAEAPLPCGIIYGTSSSLSSTNGTVLTATSDGAYSLSVTELDENTTYYYRAFVVDGEEYKYGEVRSFKTKLKISITTSQPVDVTATTATLGGEVVNAEAPLPCGIIYGTSSSLSSTSGTVLSTTSDGAYSLSVTELDENTTYYYRAYVVDGGEYKYGEVLSFKTKRGITVTTNDAADITVTTASLGGKIHGAEQDLPCGIIYGTSTTLSSTNGIVRSTTSSDDFSLSVTGLDGNTTYYYRAYVIVADEYRYGDIRSFKTKYVTVTTGSATEITDCGATLSGTVSNAEQSLACGIIYGTSTTLSTTSGTMKPTTSSGEFSVSVTGLNENTAYYYRAYVVDAGEYKYGDVLSFATKKSVTVATGDATNITTSGATLAGTISNAEESLECGIIYGTSSSLSSTSGTKKSTTSSGVYSIGLKGLNENTTYYYRAYVIDAGTYKYGVVKSFTTKKSVTVTTGDATNITTSGATLAGTISNAEESLECGIIYGTSSSLSSTSGTKKSTTSSGVYSIGLKGLNENTTYYYRAYVIDAGTYKYGVVKSFTTKKSVTVTTGDATNITTSGATLAGTISNAEESLECGIIYGTSSSLSSTSGTMKSITSSGSYSISLTGLSANTTYYYRAYAIVDGAYKYGDVLSFTTKKSVTVTTGGATNVTTNGATLAGTISNAEQSLTCGIIYGTSSSLSSTSGTMKSTTSSGSYSISLTELSANTTYYYRAYVLDAGTYKYGDVLSFTTEAESSVTSGDIIDLGLSVKWASCNVGANSPEGYGGYYAWGETDEKNNYTSGTYAYYGVSIGTDISGTEYDVAHTKLGDKWRMPTKDELGELYEKCTWQWTAINGINGYKVVGPNGNSIFLPAAGYRYGTTTDYMGMRGNTAYYWSSTKYATNQAYNLQFNETKVYGLGANGHNGYDGHSVRPVYGEISSNVEVSVTTGEATNITTSGATLAGTISNAEKSLTCGIIYGTSSSLSSTSGTMKSTTSSGVYSIGLTGLNENTTYYYRAYVLIDGEYKYGEVKSFKTMTVTIGEAIDLGLSVKWASCNVGANSPEEYGDYFAWGETTAKSSYTEDNSITYGLSTSELESRGIIGSDGNLTAAYDAATVNWGDKWRMPTSDEVKELVNSCTWKWTTINGVNGQLVTGPNGNSIFLPAAGGRDGTRVFDLGKSGNYWSGTLLYGSNIYYACNLNIWSNYHVRGSSYRYYGSSVRPVTE